ncbi:hypothetical protein [Pararhizobium sp. PWRC1-1]|uniref:hypothetical protein n=1 Tax=Pararhizobium sp. PWRC1-1 TaxID=2804566 RepID=UPI003CF219B9
MSLTSYRAAPPRVTSVFGEAEYRDKETALWRFSSIAQTEGLSLTGWAVFAFPCSFQRKFAEFVALMFRIRQRPLAEPAAFEREDRL